MWNRASSITPSVRTRPGRFEQRPRMRHFQGGPKPHLGGDPVEGINILGACVAKEKRRVVGGQAKPAPVGRGVSKIFQAEHLFQLVIPDPNAKYAVHPVCLWSANKVNVVSFARPLRPTYSDSC